MWNDFVEVFQAGLLTSCLFLLAVALVACAVVAAGPFIRDQWRRFRGCHVAAKAVAIIAAIVAVAYGGSKSHDVQNAGADDGISLAGITAAYDSTNELTAVEVKFTGGGVTTATPVSVRNAETEQWRELVKIGATITSDLPTNILAFATAGNATTNRFWWVGTNTPPVVVTTEGITITNFVASSRSVHIAWTCDDPKATQFAIQRRRVKPASISYDAEIEYLESTGAQYIDTGLVLSSNGFEYDVDLSFNSIDISIVFGGRTQTNSSSTDSIVLFVLGRSWRFDYFGNSRSGSAVAKNTRYSVSHRDGLTTVNGVAAQTPPVQPNRESGATLYVFAGHRPSSPGGVEYNSSLKLYLLRLYQNKRLVFDGQPVRAGGVGYLYDRVSGQRLGNGGSGAFGLGGDTLSYDWETVATTEGGSFDYIGFTVGESWEWRITSTYTEGE